MSVQDPRLDRILRAGKLQRPTSDAGRKRTLAALGLAVEGTAPPPNAATPKLPARSFGWTWWPVTFVAVFAAGGSWLLTRPSAKTVDAPPVSVVESAPAPVVEVAPPHDVVTAPLVTVAIPSSEPPKPRTVAPVAPPVTTAKSSLRDELVALAGVSQALSEGSCARARSALGAYRTAYPNGHLGGEADVLEIELRGRSGHAKEAGIAARRFLQQFPDTPYAVRLEPWLEERAPEQLPGCNDEGR